MSNCPHRFDLCARKPELCTCAVGEAKEREQRFAVLDRREQRQKRRRAVSELPDDLPGDAGFWRQVKPDASGCWIWIGETNWEGYGRYGGVSAHAYAYLQTNGRHEPDEAVYHRCPWRSCCNPDHLYVRPKARRSPPKDGGTA